MRYSVAACCLAEARSEFMSLRLGLVGPVNLGGLDQYGAALVAEFTVSGKLGANAGKRLLLPTQFFASNAKGLARLTNPDAADQLSGGLCGHGQRPYRAARHADGRIGA